MVVLGAAREEHEPAWLGLGVGLGLGLGLGSGLGLGLGLGLGMGLGLGLGLGEAGPPNQELEHVHVAAQQWVRVRRRVDASDQGGSLQQEGEQWFHELPVPRPWDAR